ncbi:MAG: hypothetical protein IJR14_08755, partial [Synergistaceae bacterium]|nr:hypothetical protein [Synergistaceae bacterium]
LSPMVTSGIRIGTAAVTTRGFGFDEMDAIASWIDRTIAHIGDEDELKRIRGEISELCRAKPLYPGLYQDASPEEICSGVSYTSDR